MFTSVFTPSHDPQWLDDCWASLTAQTNPAWEWVVLLNGGARWHPPVRDARVTIVTADDLAGVGAVKAAAVEQCRGDVLVELDHDDRLAPTALAEVAAAVDQHPDAGLVFTQWASIDADGAREDLDFGDLGAIHGWRYRRLVDGTLHPLSMAPTPHNVCHIWYAPNHLRAFTRTAYDKAGGYDQALDVLDDQDLMARLYTVGAFHPIDRPLYEQRRTGVNTQTQPDLNARIQVETIAMYERTIEAAALAWTDRAGLLALDLSPTPNDGYLPVGDAARALPDLPESSVGVIRAVDFLARAADPVAMMNGLHRLLAPGGLLLSLTPSSEGWGADQDPTHVSRWNPNSFWYYTDPAYATYVPDLTAQFQVSQVTHGYPTAWHQENRIGYVTANLIAVKPGMPRNGGPLLWPPLTPSAEYGSTQQPERTRYAQV
jgi:O-antigen biosynthesis protein